jgi:hypothetical protein
MPPKPRAQTSSDPTRRDAELFPVLRWVALVWILVWLPAYARVWGWANFLHVCDAAVMLTCVGIWWRSPLLLSSQAINALFADVLWCADAGWRLVSGHHLVGGTEYMWDERYPLWVRLLSLFHVALPVVLLWTLRKLGYDRRGLALQSGIALVLLVISRFFPAEMNLNYAFRDPLWHRAWGPGPVQVAVIFAGIVALLYWPTHVLLRRAFPEPNALR